VRLFFMVVRRVPPVPSPVLLEVYALLRGRGFEVEDGIAEEVLTRPDSERFEHDLYVLKSHTELALSLAGTLQALGKRLLNPYECCVSAQNKIVAARRLRAAGVPVPRSWVTGDLGLLRSVAAETPLIVKPHQGHRGAGIHLVRRPRDLDAVPRSHRPMIVQEYVRGPGEDLKVYVVGERVFAVRKPFSESSFSIPGVACEVTPEIHEIALRCGRALGLGLYGLDVIEAPTGPVVVDTNYFPGYKGVPDVAPVVADYIEDYACGRVSLDLPPAADPPLTDAERGERRPPQARTPAGAPERML